MPQFAEYISSIQHAISLTATSVLAARQTPTYKHCFFSSPTLRSCCIYAIFYMVFLIPMESACDLSLWRQGTAITSHRCVHYGVTKGVWELAGEDSGRPGAWSTLTVLPATTPGALPPNPGRATPCSLLSTGRDIAPCCGANVANMPKRKHCGMGWSVPAVFLKGMHWS